MFVIKLSMEIRMNPYTFFFHFCQTKYCQIWTSLPFTPMSPLFYIICVFDPSPLWKMATSFINGPLIIMPSSLAHCIAPLWGLFHCLKSENEREFSYDFFVMVLWNIQYIRPTILSSTTGTLFTSCSFGVPILFCNKFEVILSPACWNIIEKFIQG